MFDVWLNTLLLHLLSSHRLEWLGNDLTQIKDKTKASLVVSFSAKIALAKYTKKLSYTSQENYYIG